MPPAHEKMHWFIERGIFLRIRGYENPSRFQNKHHEHGILELLNQINWQIVFFLLKLPKRCLSVVIRYFMSRRVAHRRRKIGERPGRME